VAVRGPRVACTVALFLGLAYAGPTAAARGRGKAGAPSPAASAAAQRIREGQKLMAQKRYPEACAKFEEARNADDKASTLVLLAKCNDKAGHPAAAYTEYQEAGERARGEKNKKLAKSADAGAKRMEKKLGWITITIAATADPSDVSLDGHHVTAFGTAIAVDPGSHTVAVNGPSRSPWSTTITVAAGDTESTAIPPDTGGGGGGAVASSAAPPPASESSSGSSGGGGGSASSSSSSSSSDDSSASGASHSSEPSGEASSSTGPSADADHPREAASSSDDDEPPPHHGVVAQVEELVMLYQEPTAANGPRGGGSSLTTLATLGYDFSPAVNAFFEIGFTHNAPPTNPSGFSLSNPMFGLRYLFSPSVTPLERFHFGPELGLVLPAGTGGDDAPDAGVAFANQRARALNPTLFDPAYFTFTGGLLGTVGAGPVDVGAEVAVDEAARVRGKTVNPDASKTRMRIGARVGARVIEHVEPYVDLRYYRYLSTPSFVSTDSTSADNLFAGLGVAFQLGPLRASIGYERAFDAPLVRDSLSVVIARVTIDF